MAPVDLMLRPGKLEPTGAFGSRWRRAIAALTSLALAFAISAGSLHAQDSPGSLLVDSSSSARDFSAERPSAAPFAVSTPPLSFWSNFPSVAPRFVAIDAEQSAAGLSAPFGLSPAVGGGSGWWSVLSRWEDRLWRAERPTIVLTSTETSSISIDEEAPLMPQDGTGLAPDPTGMPPAPVGSDLQPIDACAAPPIRFSDDAWAYLPRLGHDAWGLVNWDNAIVLGVALGGSLALRGDADQDVRNWTAEHPDRWGEGSKLIGDIGVAQYQVPVILAAYAFTVWQQDDYEHQMMTSLISSYTIFGLSTLAIKGIADTSRPSDTWNGGKYGFPSWHDGSMFCMSAVIDEYEGHWIGVPLYILSGLVGWSRIDTRDHDLSDVVFGGVLGYVIGKSVAGRALYGDSRAVHIVPYVHPSEGTAGVMFDATF
jgi:hypothetical protein